MANDMMTQRDVQLSAPNDFEAIKLPIVGLRNIDRVG